MLVQILNITIIVFILTIVGSITTMSNCVTIASSDDGRPIVSYYRDGYEVGKVQGIEDDRLDGNEHNDRCPSENTTILWCIGYEIGYNDGYYNSSKILNGNR